jgi:hypothetical protein
LWMRVFPEPLKQRRETMTSADRDYSQWACHDRPARVFRNP